MKRLLFSLATTILPFASFAQNFAYDQVTPEELSMKRYAKDTSAHAVVLQEYGASKIGLGSDDYVKLFHEYHVKIKIFDNRGFDNATIQIPLRANKDFAERIYRLEGFTEYTDENGKEQKIKLDAEEIFRLNKTVQSGSLKFAFPGVKPGCVIEYQYRLESPFFENYRPWFFQGDIPKAFSEYEVHIPSFWKYNAVIKGPLKLAKRDLDVERGCFVHAGAVADCLHGIFDMKDIPAFVDEEFMTSPKNFLSAVYFEIAELTHPFGNGHKENFARNWDDVDKELKHLDSFGDQINHKGSLKSKLERPLANAHSDLEKAQVVYTYVKNAFKWNHIESPVSLQGVEKALDKHAGSSGDINLTLVAALNNAGLNAEAVLLSTRENGEVNKTHATMDDFNYVIAKVDIGTKKYFLDATDPLLPFGILPMRCLNGDGRLMHADKPSEWIPIGEDQKQSTIVTLDLTLQNDGKIKGTLMQYSNGYSAYLKRQQIKKFNSVDEYIESREQPSVGKLHMIKSTIDNLDSLNKPVIETYEIEINKNQSTDAGNLNFNPFLFDQVTNNPFKLTERNYPVDMGMPKDVRYILTMHLPDNYRIEEPIKPQSMALPNNGGKFVSDFQQHDNLFIYSHITQISKSVYWPAEYASLKEFYNQMILSERQNLVLKKIKE